jgi:hypothetical protein
MCVAAAVAPVSVALAQTNVALGKDVSVVAGSANGAALSTLTDGSFRPRGTAYQSGTVWWSGNVTTFEIALGGPYSLVGGIVQGDDNDAYRMWYRDLDTGAFEVLWDIPNFDAFGAGMQTRPNPNDDSEIFFFANAVRTDTIRIAAVSGDSANSLSEVQVYIPGPGVAAVAGVAGLAAVRRRR